MDKLLEQKPELTREGIEEQIKLKKEKIAYADFGDSTESLLQFKKKFKPESFYRTYWFYILRRWIT